jgi:hypothetical protein
MSIINCVESILKSNFEAHIQNLILNYGIPLQLHRILQGSPYSSTITTIADLNQSLAGKYFLLNTKTQAFYVYYTVDHIGADPLISGRKPIVINVPINSSAIYIASKTCTALNLVGEFNCSVNTNILTITNVDAAIVTASNAGNSGFTVATTSAGTNPDQDIEYLEVYGKKAAPVTKVSYITITGIVTGDELIPVDNYSAGTFSKGFLWTLDTNVLPGDTLVMPRQDNRNRRYVVGEREILGTTTNVMTKWKLTALGD